MAGLGAYFDGRSQAFGTALESARSYYAVEGIHELRVEIKRLRALYKMVAYITPSFVAKPNAAPLKDLFRVAGRLRDIDIFQALTVEHLGRLDLREYFNHLKHQELGLRESFAPLAGPRRMNLLSISGKKIAAALAVTSPDQVKKRMRKRICKLAGKLDRPAQKQHPHNEDLHAVRKRSKELRYVLDMWQQCCGRSQSAELSSTKLKAAYNTLGEWHDTLLARESVRRFVKRYDESKLVDAAAYRTFDRRLQDRANQQLNAYGRVSKQLRMELQKFITSIQQIQPRSKTAGRHKRVTERGN